MCELIDKAKDEEVCCEEMAEIDHWTMMIRLV